MSADELTTSPDSGDAMSESSAERVGLASDRIDNLLHAAQLPMPPAFHLKQITRALEEIRDELRDVVVEETGNNPWK